jgi:hypothetical protein
LSLIHRPGASATAFRIQLGFPLFARPLPTGRVKFEFSEPYTFWGHFDNFVIGQIFSDVGKK